ncbi:MAG: GerMN domain-containing protein [Candidatus Hydromicrobium sp.]|nr:GerMN domain-containing protein [Candidatus Hydromicrobium sp.]
MDIRNKQTKKRKKRPSPILRFTFIIILLVAAGSIIFYSIDYPDFVKNKFSSLFNKNESELIVSDLPETDTGQLSSSVEEPVTGEDSGENEIESIDTGKTTTEESIDSDQTGSGLSLWQKIKNYFINRKNDVKDGKVYPSRLEVNFYFSGLGEEKKLVSEKRTIIAGSPDIAVKNAVQELLKGPTQSYHFPLIPAGTKLLNVETYENIAEIDLSQEFLENSLDTRILDEYIIYSIVNTLTEIPEIEGIIFYIEGIRIKIYGNVDLSIPAIRDKEYIDEE